MAGRACHGGARRLLGVLIVTSALGVLRAEAEDGGGSGAGTSTASKRGSTGAQSSTRAQSSTGAPSAIARGGSGVETPALERAPVTYHGTTVFFLADGTPRARERAQRVSTALQRAIEAVERGSIDAPLAETRSVSSATVAVYVRGHLIVELGQRDGAVNGYPQLAAYAQELDDTLGLFVADQRRRASLQGIAVRTFLAGLIFLLGMLSLRLLRYLFHRADEYIDERRGAFRPVTILQVPIVSEQTVGATVAFALAIGRIASFVAVGVLTLSLSLSQFDVTRQWVSAVLNWATQPLVGAIEGLIGSLPGLALAALLLVALKGILRVIRVLSHGVRVGRVAGRGLTPQRASVLRLLLSVFAVLAIVPFVIAAALGRYHTPLEVVVLIASGVFLVACMPLLASGAVGLGVLWRGHVRVGEWIEAGRAAGTVTAVSPWEVEVESAVNGRARIPMLSLLLTPLVSSRAEPAGQIRVVVARRAPVSEMMAALEQAMRRVVPSARVECLGFTADAVRLAIHASFAEVGARHRMMLAILELGQAQVIEILEAG